MDFGNYSGLHVSNMKLSRPISQQTFRDKLIWKGKKIKSETSKCNKTIISEFIWFFFWGMQNFVFFLSVKPLFVWKFHIYIIGHLRIYSKFAKPSFCFVYWQNELWKIWPQNIRLWLNGVKMGTFCLLLFGREIANAIGALFWNNRNICGPFLFLFFLVWSVKIDVILECNMGRLNDGEVTGKKNWVN